MSRLEEWIHVLETEGAALQSHHPLDAALFSMLVHFAFADGEVQEEEFTLLHRLMPGADLGEVLVQVADTSQRPLDLAALVAAVPDALDRERLAKLASLMVWGDNHLDPGEVGLLNDLIAAIQAG